MPHGAGSAAKLEQLQRRWSTGVTPTSSSAENVHSRKHVAALLSQLVPQQHISTFDDILGLE